MLLNENEEGKTRSCQHFNSQFNSSAYTYLGESNKMKHWFEKGRCHIQAVLIKYYVLNWNSTVCREEKLLHSWLKLPCNANSLKKKKKKKAFNLEHFDSHFYKKKKINKIEQISASFINTILYLQYKLYRLSNNTYKCTCTSCLVSS